jgi:hypothetical protein
MEEVTQGQWSESAKKKREFKCSSEKKSALSTLHISGDKNVSVEGIENKL